LITTVTTDRPRDDSDSTRLSWPSCWHRDLDRVGDLASDVFSARPRVGGDDERFFDRKLGIFKSPHPLVGEEAARDDEEHRDERDPVLADG
jgi:hypothetical protein